MNLKNFTKFAFVFTVCIALWSSQGMAQEAIDKLALRVVQLKYADASQVINVARSVLDGQEVRMESHAELNAIIIYAKPDAFQLFGEIIKELDQPDQQAAQPHVELIQLQHITSDDAIAILSNLLSNTDSGTFRLASDEKSNALILSGLPEQLEMVKQIVSRIDIESTSNEPVSTDTTNCVVRVTWLVDQTSSQFEDLTLPEPASSLNDLANELQENGTLKKPRMLTRTETLVEARHVIDSRRLSHFSNSSSRAASGGVFLMDTEGDISKLADGKFRLNIALKMGQQRVQTVSTSISLPENHPVAISMSHVDDLESVAVVEILNAD